ncbi:hypothetical protein CANINC_000542 [Pichia inconspicua]|uniref:CS domain-containing protein n=1 Tax=Pichia inconspicua TaxID=52247 RepID=A0A4T0X6A0_9ASCO|nr:hypothetical protein CANINC_000542 [[Candida] inconspicua]
MLPADIKVSCSQGYSDLIHQDNYIEITVTVDSPAESIVDIEVHKDRIDFYMETTNVAKANGYFSTKNQYQFMLELYKEVLPATSYIFLSKHSAYLIVLKRDLSHKEWTILNTNVNLGASVGIDYANWSNKDGTAKYPPDCDLLSQKYDTIFKPSESEVFEKLSTNKTIYVSEKSAQYEQHNHSNFEEEKRVVNLTIEVETENRLYFFQPQFDEFIWSKITPDTEIIKLADFIEREYPFLRIKTICDLPLFSDELNETIRDFWTLYKVPMDRTTFENENDNDMIFINVRCEFMGSENSHDMLVELVDRYPLENDTYRKAVPRISSNIQDANVGNLHKRNGKSFDTFIEYETAVDQLHRSTISYDFYDEETGKHTYLSSQQCILVATEAHKGKFEPYILVNKSGMARLEQLMPIEQPYVRISKSESNREGHLDNNRVNEVTRQLLDAVNDSVFAESKFETVPIDEKRLRELIEQDILRLVSSIDVNVNINQQENGNQREEVIMQLNFYERGLVRIYQTTKEKLQRLYRVWISSGLLMRLLNLFMRYAVRCFTILIIIARLGVVSIRVTLLVVFLNLMQNEYIDAIREVAGVTGFRPVYFCYIVLKHLHDNLERVKSRSISTVILTCLAGRRGGADGIAMLPVRQLQDSVLLVVTLLPPFAQEYRVQMTEQQQQEQQQQEQQQQEQQEQ